MPSRPVRLMTNFSEITMRVYEVFLPRSISPPYNREGFTKPSVEIFFGFLPLFLTQRGGF